MEIISHIKPKLTHVKFTVDNVLHKKLKKYPMLAETSLCKSHSMIAIAKPGSGKTTFLLSLLEDCYAKVFHNVYVVMKRQSRESIQGDLFERVDKVYDELDFTTMNSLMENIKDNASSKETTLVYMDDVQQSLKEKEVEKLLGEMFANRRHLRLTIWIAVQNFKSIPVQIRNNTSTFLVFSTVGKQEKEAFFEQIATVSKPEFEMLDKLYKKPYDFLLYDVNYKKIFNQDWEEIRI